MRSSGMIKRANNFDRYQEVRVSTSTLYDSTRQALQQALPAIRATQLESLAHLSQVKDREELSSPPTR